MNVSMQLYCLALKKRSAIVNLAKYKSIDKALKNALTNSDSLEKHITKQLNESERVAGEAYTLKYWKAKKRFGFDSPEDTDLSMSIGRIRIYIYVKVLDVTEEEYKCEVNLSMSDIYDFESLDQGYNKTARIINNYLGYLPQEKGLIHPYQWHYSCTFTKNYQKSN